MPVDNSNMTHLPKGCVICPTCGSTMVENGFEFVERGEWDQERKVYKQEGHYPAYACEKKDCDTEIVVMDKIKCDTN